MKTTTKRASHTLLTLALLPACNGGGTGDPSAPTTGASDSDGPTGSTTDVAPNATEAPTTGSATSQTLTGDATTEAPTTGSATSQTLTGDATTEAPTTGTTTGDATTEPTDPCEPNPCTAPQNCVEGACVDPAHPAAGEVILVEMMIDVRELGDNNGEWIEFKNVSDRHVDLNGCTLSDVEVGAAFPIDAGGPLVIAPGALVLMGKTTDAAVNGGITVDHAYGDAIALNDTNGIITLACAELPVDIVEYFAGLWPYGTGDGLQLDPGHEDATANDDPESWCRALEEYAPPMNTGTPGAPNPPCR
ncbi:lamin tail domain-containing protein [Nannocystis exedens]|uniref:lamin tail domain-containing protein n=1 Tax=Nannocystis exedens TaxID=54 RepID=UPI000BBA0E71|nr:lamin tail domain-containing protein [Nannocystis exedens]PCC68817.1 extracellular nuclease [Nannocystis exedens]